MKPGPLIRTLLPQSLEVRAAAAYRSVFIDLDKVAVRIAEALPPDANVLDIGGGDGELLNRLFAIRADLRVTMVDVANSVGRFVKPQYRSRVRLMPGTTIESHLGTLDHRYDAAIVVDVMHHIALDQRKAFLQSVNDALLPGGILLIKDVEPGYFRATLGYLCDRYISGDRGVVLVPAAEIATLLASLTPGAVAEEVGLFEDDRPNYLVKVRRA